MPSMALTLPPREGDAPRTTSTNPHTQLEQNAPVELQEELWQRMASLPDVTPAPSRISVPGARAITLDEAHAQGAPEALIVDGEFAHLHPHADGSLHLTLPRDLAEEVVAKGWGEPHVVVGWAAPMVYGPRDASELEIVWSIVQASYEHARGIPAPN
jgi:hypothetical protein